MLFRVKCYIHLPAFVLQVVLKVLDPRFEIENPYSPYIQGMSCSIFVPILFLKVHVRRVPCHCVSVVR